MIRGVMFVRARDSACRRFDLFVNVAVWLPFSDQFGKGLRPREGHRVVVRRRSTGSQRDCHHHHRGEGQAKHGADESSLHNLVNTRGAGAKPFAPVACHILP